MQYDKSQEAKPANISVKTNLLQVDPACPEDIAESLLRSVQEHVPLHCSVLGPLPHPVDPTITWLGNSRLGATFVDGPFDHDNLSRYVKDLETMLSNSNPNGLDFAILSNQLQRTTTDSLALLPVDFVELCRSTLKCTYKYGGAMDLHLQSVDGIETQELYKNEEHRSKFVLVSFGTKSEANDLLAQQSMQGYRGATRTIESPSGLEARFEQYVSDGMDRKLLKGFARDIVDCLMVGRATSEAQIHEYQNVFKRFALHEAVKRLANFSSSDA